MAETFDDEGNPVDQEGLPPIDKEVIEGYLEKARVVVKTVDNTVGIGPAALGAGLILTAFGGYKLISSAVNKQKNNNV